MCASAIKQMYLFYKAVAEAPDGIAGIANLSELMVNVASKENVDPFFRLYPAPLGSVIEQAIEQETMEPTVAGLKLTAKGREYVERLSGHVHGQAA